MPIETITWSTVAIAAAAITAAVLVCSRRKEEFRVDRILWVYAGAFASISIVWGLYEIIFVAGGYGTGDIF